MVNFESRGSRWDKYLVLELVTTVSSKTQKGESVGRTRYQKLSNCLDPQIKVLPTLLPYRQSLLLQSHQSSSCFCLRKGLMRDSHPLQGTSAIHHGILISLGTLCGHSTNLFDEQSKTQCTLFTTLLLLYELTTFLCIWSELLASYVAL